MRKKFLMNVLKSTQKISVSGFLLLYTFTPSALAISDISAYADDSSVEIDESENIANEGVSDPAQIAKGVDIVNNKEDEDGNDIAVVESKTKNETENILTSSAPRAPTVAELKSTSVLLSDTGQYTISSTSGTWSSVVCTGSNCNLSGVGTNEIKWGSPATWGGDKSGLLFTSQSESQSFNAGQTFLIGTLTHQNWPVTGDTAKNATLNVSLDFSNPELVTNPQFSYQFNIKETSNGYSSYKNCPGFPSEQNSTTPCDDVITFPNAYGENSFTIGDIKYTLKIDGFQSQYQNGTAVQKFITEEEKNNVAYLVGHLSTQLVERPAVSIIKKVNGEDANTAPGIYIGVGDPINFSYIIQNTGNIKLTEIVVADNKGITVTCPYAELEIGNTMTCTGSTIATLGQYTNIGTVSTSQGVSASDSANYYGVKKVDICHATDSASNPYTGAQASMTGDVSGHDKHNGDIWYPGISGQWGDIIPQFTLPDNSTYPGKNWNAYGQAILSNNCSVPSGTITVKKVVNPEIAGDTTSFGITGTGTANVSGAPTFLDGNNTGSISTASSHTFNVFPGTYSFSETLPDGWSLVSNDCTNIVVSKGDNKECTITNTKNSSLTIVKKALPASENEFEFNLVKGGNTISTFGLIDNSNDTDASKTFSLLPGTYSVFENDYSTSWNTFSSCDNGDSVESISLASGDSVTCTFTNTKYASISGYKINDADGNQDTTDDQTHVPNWGIELWDSDTNRLKETTTSLEGSYIFSNILPGTYWVKEVLTAGWAVLTVSEQEVTVVAGEDKTNINFVNYKKGSIKVIKNVDGNGDGDLNDSVDVKGADDWKWRLNTTEYSTGTVASNLTPGTYTISEVNKDNYHFVSLECSGGSSVSITGGSAVVNLKSGEDVVCTYTNARNLGKLIVVKNVINDNGGTKSAQEFSFKIDSENAQSFIGSELDKLVGRNEYTRYSGLTHSITEVEANSNGYATTYDNCSNITIPYGGKVTCTITNNDVAPELTVIKKVVNDNGGDAVVGDFGIKLNENGLTFGEGVLTESTSTTTYTSNPDVSSNVSYTLTELDVSGYEEGTWSCVDNTNEASVSMPFSLNEGQSVTCTITNNDIAPQLELQKIVTYRSDLPESLRRSSDSWLLKAIGTSSTLSGNGFAKSDSTFKAGEYTLSEEGDLTGYEASGWDCGSTPVLSGNKINLVLGQYVYCTITNSSTYGKVTIKKVAYPTADTTTSFDFASDGLWTDKKPLVNQGTIVKYVVPGSYSVTEDAKEGWRLSSISCTDSDSTVDTSNQNKVNINVSNKEDVTCTFTNEKLGRIYGYKYEDSDGDGTWDTEERALSGWKIMLNDLSSTSSTQASTITDANGFYEFKDLIPDHNYTVTEESKISWTQTSLTPSSILIEPGSDIQVNFGNFKNASITVHKTVLDINGKWAYDDSRGFEVSLKKNGDNVIASSVVSMSTNPTFLITGPGVYSISEKDTDNYEELGCLFDGSDTVDVKSGIDYDIICTNQQKAGTVEIEKEVTYKGDKNAVSNEEFPIIFTNSKDKEVVTRGVISDSTTGKVNMTIQNLNPGEYTLVEENVDGYIQKGCFFYDDGSTPKGGTTTVSVGSNANVKYICENEVLTPYLKVEKKNNTNGEAKMPGDDVSYTITISAPSDEYEDTLYVVNDVKILDLLPIGFQYIKGSWSAESSLKSNLTLNEPEYSGEDYAEWSIGNIKEGEIITLKYTASISEDQEPGTYPDITWSKGVSLLNTEVIANVSLGDKTPFVGTEVTVNAPEEIEEGEVLGASTTIYLPDTGAKTYIVLVALTSIVLGLFMVLPKHRKSEKKFSKMIHTSIFVTIFLIISSMSASAGYIDVKIEKPKSPTNATQFNIAFVAMTSDNSPITVKCFKDGDSDPFQEINAKVGNCLAKVDESGIYKYYVVASTVSGMEKRSDSVEVTVNLDKPQSIVNYSKTGNTLNFTTANDGLTTKVQIFRSEDVSFTANAGTLVHTMNVVPNAEYTWTDSSAESGKVYYYALRAVDDLGNVSPIVSDEKVVTVLAKEGTTQTTQGQTLTTALEVQGEESVAGVTSESEAEVDSSVKGDMDVADTSNESKTNEQESNEDTTESKEEETSDAEESSSSYANKWYLWVGGLLIVAVVGYLYARKHQQAQ